MQQHSAGYTVDIKVTINGNCLANSNCGAYSAHGFGHTAHKHWSVQ
jgi:hypothetical protein